MQAKEIQIQSYSLTEVRTYLFAVLFAAGNIVLPQLFHLVHLGGVTWLPIYFFTLVAAYKYGRNVGLLVALASPIVNSLLFGMPPLVAVPTITVKSVLLAIAASFAAQRFQKVNLLILIGVVLFYQAVGTLVEWGILGELEKAMQDFRIGVPGMLLQVFGGFFIIKYLIKNK